MSAGRLTVRDTANQQQDVSGLSRDTAHASDGSITPIFNKEKEQKRLQQAQLVSDIASQALDIYNTHEATKATREATAALAAPAIALALYGTADSSRLTSGQKENLSALATLAAGIASGVSGGSTQVSIRALQAVHASTHPAECSADNGENKSHNDTTVDTTKSMQNEHNPLQDR